MSSLVDVNLATVTCYVIRMHLSIQWDFISLKNSDIFLWCLNVDLITNFFNTRKILWFLSEKVKSLLVNILYNHSFQMHLLDISFFQ